MPNHGSSNSKKGVTKTSASKPNELMLTINAAVAKAGGNIGNGEWQSLIENHFQWELVLLLSPLSTEEGNEHPTLRRLRYRTDINGAWSVHLYVTASGMENAGNGLYSERRFRPDDIISVYLGKRVRNKNTHTTYKWIFHL